MDGFTCLEIVLEGDGALKENAGRTVPARLTKVIALAGGMQSGRPSVALVVEAEGKMFIGETSLALFLSAADAFKARHGDPRMDEDTKGREASVSNEVPPVDRGAVTTLHGTPIDELRVQQAAQPIGMHADYIVLSDEERAKGFVRPVRRTYRHETCGSTTTMGLKLAETYARDPKFYGSTFCCNCDAHFPVGPDGEFTWDNEPSAKVGT